MYGVDFDVPKQHKLQLAKQQMHINFPVFLQNPQKYFQLPDVGVVPTTFIISPSGQLVRQLMGPQTLASLQKAFAQVRLEHNMT